MWVFAGNWEVIILSCKCISSACVLVGLELCEKKRVLCFYLPSFAACYVELVVSLPFKDM